MDSAKVNDIVVESKEAELNDVVTEKVDENDSLVDDKSPTFGFTEPSWRTDFCLVVEGTKLYVAKLILSLASPVFDTMFQSDFKEKSCDELELPGKKLSDVIAFLRCIYPNTCAEINHDNALVILPLLEEYQALQHKPRCEAVLLDSVTEETTTDELLKLLKYACMYNLQKLRAKCISLISSRPYDELDYSYCKSFPSADALNEIFLNVNTSMKSKLAELEQVVEEYELLKKYISSEVIAKNFKDLKCDSEKKWDDKTVILIDVVPAMNNESEGKVVDIWGIPIKICMKREGNNFCCEIRNTGRMKVICDISAHCILVNRQPNGCNHVVNDNGMFNQWVQKKTIEITNMFKFENFASSFDGKVGIIIQLLMTKPNLKK